MSDSKLQSFDTRLRKIDEKNRALARGYVMSVNHDGLMIARPKPRRRGFPWRSLLIILAGFLLFKGVLFAQIGAEEYDARVANLSQGNLVEQVGGYVMHADPVTLWLGAQFEGLLR